MDNEPVEVKTVEDFFSESAVVAELKTNSNLNLDFLSANFGITADMLEVYYKFSKFKYECGMYTEAEAMLGHYLSVIQPHSPSHLGALWGRLACRIVQAKWGESLEDLHAVKEAIEIRSISSVDQLRQRAWLMHWGLFVYMNRGSEGVEKLAYLFSEKATPLFTLNLSLQHLIRQFLQCYFGVISICRIIFKRWRICAHGC